MSLRKTVRALKSNYWPSNGGDTFSLSTQEIEAGGSLEFKANLIYRVSSRTVKATQRNSVSKKKSNCNRNLSEIVTVMSRIGGPILQVSLVR